MSLDRCLQDMRKKDALLSYSMLIELSSLSSAEMQQFKETWAAVSSKRRLMIIQRLVEMAESNPELHFAAVFKACLKDGDDEVREHAISGLWEEEHRTIVPCLVEMLTSDPSNQVRAKAASALGKFASLAQDGKLLHKDCELVKSSLMQALENEEENTEVRRCALEAVAPFDTSQIREYINWAYGNDDNQWKCSSLYAMGRTGKSEWSQYVIKEMSSPESIIRYGAANACGELGEEEIVPNLISLLQDEDVQVQLAVVNALGNIGGPLAKRALSRCVKIGDPTLEEASREALEIVEAMEDPLAFKSEP